MPNTSWFSSVSVGRQLPSYPQCRMSPLLPRRKMRKTVNIKIWENCQNVPRSQPTNWTTFMRKTLDLMFANETLITFTGLLCCTALPSTETRSYLLLLNSSADFKLEQPGLWLGPDRSQSCKLKYFMTLTTSGNVNPCNMNSILKYLYFVPFEKRILKQVYIYSDWTVLYKQNCLIFT